MSSVTRGQAAPIFPSPLASLLHHHPELQPALLAPPLHRQRPRPRTAELDSRLSTPSIEHIIQDAGTSGIEEFARELGAEFHRNSQPVFQANPSVTRPVESSGYSTGVRHQPSAIPLRTGLKKTCAWIHDQIQSGSSKDSIFNRY